MSEPTVSIVDVADPASLLSRPAGIEPDITFWTRIYTEIDTQSGFIHDSRFLGVVYEVVHFKPGTTRRGRNKQVKKAKERYRAMLKRLARGKRDNLSAEEQRVLDVWGADTSNKALRSASSRLRFQLGQ